MAQIPLARRWVVGVLGRIETCAAFFILLGIHQLCECGDYIACIHQQAASAGLQRLHPAPCGFVVLRVPNAQRCLTLRRVVCGRHASNVRIGKHMLNAGIVDMPASLENFDARRQRSRLCRRGGLIHGVMVPTHPAGRPLIRLNNPPGLPVNQPAVQKQHRSAAGKARQCVQKRSKGT